MTTSTCVLWLFRTRLSIRRVGVLMRVLVPVEPHDVESDQLEGIMWDGGYWRESCGTGVTGNLLESIRRSTQMQGPLEAAGVNGVATIALPEFPIVACIVASWQLGCRSVGI